MKTDRQRLDSLLVSRGLFESREKAQRAIMAGHVRVGEKLIDKPGTAVATDMPLRVQESDRYVSRGGHKLEAALQHFALDPMGRICLDIGASTGGFTDCLLQHGAARVYAFDVGHDQLHWKIRSDPRVQVREKFNVRHMTEADIPERIDLCVIDVSFISLTLILPPAFASIHRDGVIIALIKPQFELDKNDVEKGGVIKDPALHQRVIEKIRRFVCDELHKQWIGVIDSPILGAAGNKEFLACLRH